MDTAGLHSEEGRLEEGLGAPEPLVTDGDDLAVGKLVRLLHVVPVSHDAVLNGVLQGQNTSLALSLVSDIGVLLSHADHDALVAGPPHDGGEDGSGSIISGESGFAHTGSIVNNQSGNLV